MSHKGQELTTAGFLLGASKKASEVTDWGTLHIPVSNFNHVHFPYSLLLPTLFSHQNSPVSCSLCQPPLAFTSFKSLSHMHYFKSCPIILNFHVPTFFMHIHFEKNQIPCSIQLFVFCMTVVKLQ